MSVELSIVVVSYNTRDLLRQCLESVFSATRRESFEVIVVDNNSTDDSCALVKAKFPQVRLIENQHNAGFGGANNQGVEASRGSHVMLLNSDAVLLEDTGSALVEFLKTHPEAGVVGPRVLLMDGSLQPKTYGNLPSFKAFLNQSLLLARLFPKSRTFAGIYVESAWDRVMEVGWISGVCMVLAREDYLAINGFDPAFFMYSEDMDLCRRLRERGRKCYRVDAFGIRHLCAGSTKTPEQFLKHDVMRQRNFIRMLDSCAGSHQVTMRVILGIGLALRVIVRSVYLVVPNAGGRLAFQSALQCLMDLTRRTTPEGGSYAHRH